MYVPRFAREIGGLAWRRRILVVGVALMLLLAAVVTTFLLPRMHESFTRVRIIGPRALHDLYGNRLEGAERLDDLVRSIRREILSTESAERVVADLGLDAGLEALSKPERSRARAALVEQITSSTSVNRLKADPGQAILRITHRSTDPAVAQRIVTELATGFRKGGSGGEDNGLPDTFQSAREEVSRLQTDLSCGEAEVAEFRSSHEDLAPDEAEALDTACECERLAIRSLDSEILALDRKLNEARAQLADEPEWTLAGDGSGRTRNLTHQELKKTMVAVAEKLSNVRDERRRRQANLDLLLRRQSSLPALKAELLSLEKRCDTLRASLVAAKQQETAAVNEWLLSQSEQAVIFDVLDSPVYPVRPNVPNQIVIAVLGLVIGLGAGIGTVVVLDLFDDSIRDVEGARVALALPVLGGIDCIRTEQEKRRARVRTRLSLVAVLAMLFLIGIALFVQVTADGDVGSLMARVVELVG